MDITVHSGKDSYNFDVLEEYGLPAHSSGYPTGVLLF